MPFWEPKNSLPLSSRGEDSARLGRLRVQRKWPLSVFRATTRPAWESGRAREDGSVHGVASDSRGGGRQGPETPAPEGLTGVLIDRVKRGVVAELEDSIARHDRWELEQGAPAACPHRPERRSHRRRGREEAGVVLGVAVQRPSEMVLTFCLRQSRRGLRHERCLWVVDVAGAVFLVEVARQRYTRKHEQRDGHYRQPALGRAWEAGGSVACRSSVSLQSEEPPLGGESARRWIGLHR